jgi:hypothetical protein
MIALVIWTKWALRYYVWFWATIAAISTFHLFVILCVPWPETWIPAVLMKLIITADFIFILWIVVAVEGLMLQARDSTEKTRRSRKG